MRASLADQPGPPGLAIALGANLPSPAGEPIDTLVAVRPQLEALLRQWRVGLGGDPAMQRCHWSPLFATAPVGGPPDQPLFCNAVVVLEGELGLSVASAGAALELLMGLHQLEQLYGRQRRERWGPRSLDLDLLWWGDLAVATARLALPHPRWHQRSFVLAPLLAIERRRGEPLWCPHPAGLDAAAAAAVCVAATESPPQSVPQSPPQPLPPRTGWPE